MAHSLTFASLSDFWTQYAHLIEVLYAEAQGARWGLPRERFAESLHRSAERRFRDGRGNAAEVEAYLKSLHLQDLALACACSEGIEAAWEFFIAHFREDLRTASRGILRSSGPGNDARAEELADSLYAELYGIRSGGGGRRKSLFDYFHGRSKLSTWLRAVLAQRHVDLLRTDHGTISLDSGSHSRDDGRPDGRGDGVAIELQAATDPAPADPDRAKYLARLDRALLAAFACLTPRERMLLSWYYVDHRTLGEIGRTVGEHESTVSRQLERTRRVLRETVTDLLRRGAPAQDGNGGDPALDVSQIELTFEYALEDWPFDLSQALSKAGPAADPPDQ